MKIICINGQWYVYLAGPFGSLEAAEQKKTELMDEALAPLEERP